MRTQLRDTVKRHQCTVWGMPLVSFLVEDQGRGSRCLSLVVAVAAVTAAATGLAHLVGLQRLYILKPCNCHRLTSWQQSTARLRTSLALLQYHHQAQSQGLHMKHWHLLSLRSQPQHGCRQLAPGRHRHATSAAQLRQALTPGARLAGITSLHQQGTSCFDSTASTSHRHQQAAAARVHHGLVNVEPPLQSALRALQCLHASLHASLHAREQQRVPGARNGTMARRQVLQEVALIAPWLRAPLATQEL